MTTNIKDYSTTQANNTSLNTIDVNEGMLPSNLNNAIRALMKNTRDWFNDAQWIEYGDGSGAFTAAYASATSFTIAGADVTSVYHAGRRIKLTAATPGTIFGTIASSSFSTNTTVNVTWDSGSLASEAITNVYVGALSKTNSSIPEGIVVTATLADGSVTLAKLAADSVNGTKIADDSIDSEHYVDGSIDTAHIANSQITVDKMAVNSVNSDQYVDGSIDLIHLSADSVDGTKIADDSINSEHYVDGSIDTAHIADAQITTAKIADSQITSAKITDGAIVNADINASAAIDATKIADGSVTSTEFQYINTLSSNAQTQLDAKVVKASNLSDLASASTSRTNLGLGTIATQAANSVAISGGTITGLGTPSASSDAATKVYVDNLVTGLKTRIITRTATTGNITLSSDLQNGDTLDGITLATGNKVLVKDQTDATENGIYDVVASGTATRNTDYDTVAELAGQLVIVQEGSANADKIFLCTTDNSGSIGSVNITFTVVQPSNVGDVTLNGTQTLTNKTLTDAVAITNSVTGEIIPGKIEGTNFTDSLLIGHATTGTLNAAQDNTGVGIGALDALTSGDKNTAVGSDAGTALTTASNNTLIGYEAGKGVVNANMNTVVGDNAFAGTNSDSNSASNTVVGAFAMNVSSGAKENTAIGRDAGREVTTGDGNIFIGYNAGANDSTSGITTGSGNVIIGTVDPDSRTGDRQLKITGNDGSTATTWISGDNNGIVTFADDLIIKDSGTIGSASDTDLLTLGSAILTVAGEVSMTTLDIGGTNVTSTAAELNILDGVTSTAAELNILDGVTTTAAEINLIDGGTARGTTAVADADGILHNDNGTMRMTSAATFKTYFQSGLSTSSAADDITAGDAAVNITTSSGNITIDAAANDTDIIFKGTDDSSDITMLTLDGSDAGTAIFNHDIKLADNGKAIFGTGGDLEIYHDTNHSYVEDVGTGELRLKTNGSAIRFQHGSETLSLYTEDGSVELYHDDSKKFETASTGVIVTGSILPAADDTHDLGSSSKQWRDIYTGDINLNNTKTRDNEVDGSRGSWTIQEGSDDLFLLNRLNGKKYKFNLTEV